MTLIRIRIRIPIRIRTRTRIRIRTRISHGSPLVTRHSKLLLLFFFLGTILMAQQSPTVIKITDPKKYSDDFHEFIEEVSFLALETRPDCMMPGNSGTVRYYKDLIIVHYGSQQGLYVFTKGGKFLSYINPLGQGPGEVLSINAIDVYDDELFLFDFKGGKIVIVDIEGKFKRLIKTPLFPYDIIHNKSGRILMYQQKELFEGVPHDIVGYDEETQEFFSYLPAQHLKQSRFLPSGIFHYSPSGPVMSVTVCDTVYDVSGDEAEPKYILDWGKFSLTEEQKKTFMMMDIRGYGKRAMTLWRGWHEAGDMISFLYHTDERWDNLLFYDQEKKKFYGGKWDYPDFELGRIYYPSGTTDDSYVFVIQALTIIEEAEEHSERCSEALKKVAKGLKEDDNPVIMTWKVKGKR